MSNFKNVPLVAVINDLSSFGKCSLAAALPLFAALNVQACPLPTAVLSCQTGFDGYYIKDLSECWAGYARCWQKMGVEFDAIVSGFFADAEQVKKAREFIKNFKKEKTTIVVDPVLGDGGKTYDTVDQALKNEMSLLVDTCDVATPNLTELCLLCQKNYDQVVAKHADADYFDFLYGLCRTVIDKGCKNLVVTGVKYGKNICNIIADKNGYKITKSPYYGVNLSGAGDILTTIVTAKVLNGKSVFAAAKYADSFLTKCIKDTVKHDIDRNHGINFEKYLKTLK